MIISKYVADKDHQGMELLLFILSSFSFSFRVTLELTERQRRMRRNKHAVLTSQISCEGHGRGQTGDCQKYSNDVQITLTWPGFLE